MLTAATWDAIYRWLALRHGAPVKALRRPGIWTQAHGPALADYHGVSVWRIGDMALVSAPADLAERVRGFVAGQPSTALLDPAFWRGALGDAAVERAVGPAYQGFVDASAFRPAPMSGARPLTPADQPALSRFIAACPPDAWQDSAITTDDDVIFALERDGALVALASAPADAQAMRSVGVVTLPAWRGHGAGRAVVAALTAHWLARDVPLLHYQTLRANLPSMAIAHALGYEDAATTLAIRLR
jgi:GNAT superfamily N-acetyltransferase